MKRARSTTNPDHLLDLPADLQQHLAQFGAEARGSATQWVREPSQAVWGRTAGTTACILQEFSPIAGRTDYTSAAEGSNCQAPESQARPSLRSAVQSSTATGAQSINAETRSSTVLHPGLVSHTHRQSSTDRPCVPDTSISSDFNLSAEETTTSRKPSHEVGDDAGGLAQPQNTKQRLCVLQQNKWDNEPKTWS